MITSAASTLDSTFSSFSKMLTIDLNLGKTVSFGRIMMVIVAVLGTIPVFLNAEILSATTISGTMVIGLTPVFLLWKMDAPKISYFLSVIAGLVFGVLLIFEIFPEVLIHTSGKYSLLLWINFYGIITSLILFLIPIWFKK
ncbi:sodium/solute symporter [Nonlabens ulvanivorans]|nr:sodium/solute symporter [Nonlabens ulvanivorans]